MQLSNTVAIVGAAESDQIGRVPDKPAIMLHAEAARSALAEAGLTKDDVDGLFTAGITTLELGEYLGINPRYADGGNVGGSSFVIHIGHAALALAAGRCEVALITHGESGRSRVGMFEPEPPPDWICSGSSRRPTACRCLGSYALAAHRHMHEYGTTKEQLAEIAVATRKWAQLNPKALFRDPMTIQDVLDSPIIAWPFNRLDCCLVTDAGGAIVMTTLERARGLKQKPVSVLGFGEAHRHALISQMTDLTSFAARESGRAAFEMAGVTHDDIDLAMIYDSFTYTVLVTLEDLGFCAKGEGGAFVCGPAHRPRRRFPMNTSGGGLSYTHPGMYGMFAIIEAVRQLRGDYADQGDPPGPRLRTGRRPRHRLVPVVGGDGDSGACVNRCSVFGTWCSGMDERPLDHPLREIEHEHRIPNTDRKEPTMSDYQKPLPEPDPVSLPYWDSLKAHALELQRCGGCGKFIFYPRGICPHCFSGELGWEKVAGRGTIHSYTIIHRHWQPGFAAEAPYVVALVELDEGVRLVANLVDVAPDPAADRLRRAGRAGLRRCHA